MADALQLVVIQLLAAAIKKYFFMAAAIKLMADFSKRKVVIR